MEVKTTSSVGAIKSRHSNTHVHHHHHSSHSQNHRHAYYHKNLASNTNLIIIIATISIILVLLAIFFIILILRRLIFSSGSNRSCKNSTKNRAMDDTISCRFLQASPTMSFHCSPDVKGGCLSGGNMSMMSMRGRGGNNNNNNNKRVNKGVQVLTYREIEMATEGFSEENVIKNVEGCGLMYRGVLNDGTLVAIKMLPTQAKQAERAFRLQVDLLSRLQCPYLVELVGYCADQHHRILILEYMGNGTLYHHLHSRVDESKPLDWWSRMRIALDCARALEFLHEHVVPSLIHRDFNCNRVLLDHNFRAKVSDLGFAKIGSDKINGLISTSVLGTTGYLAPEYARSGKVSTKSDVYSYGVVLLELLTGRVPVDINRPPGQHVLVSWALPRLTSKEKLEEMVDPALRGHYSTKDLIQIGAIAAMCIQPEADYRPLMTDVVQSLIPLVRSTCVSSFSSPTSQKHASSSTPTH